MGLRFVFPATGKGIGRGENMIPWIQIYSNLIHHPKTTNLADELGIRSADANPNAVAAGMLVSLWLWAAQNATDGDLSRCSDRAIAEAAEYKKKPSAFVSALVKARWLDEDRKLHKWEEYATLLQDMNDRQKANTAERVRRLRERRKQEKAVTETADCGDDVTHNQNTSDEERESCNGYCNVTVTQCNAPTLPNNTLPISNIVGPPKTTQGEVTCTAPAPHEPPTYPPQDLGCYTRPVGNDGKEAYGVRQLVRLRQSEYDRLILEFGEMNVMVAIVQMGKWLMETPEEERPKEHYPVLRKKLRKEPLLRDNGP